MDRQTSRTMSLRERLRDHQPLLAVFSIIPSAEIIEIVALAGFDAVILDTEHGAFGIETLGPLIVAARSRGLFAIVRVRTNAPSLIGAALDAGAAGVLVPQVASKSEAEAAVSAARFSPEGTRGAHPWVRAADFGAADNWFSRANGDAAVIVMIEGVAGVAATPDILETAGLDGIFIGPVDLSHALGVPGQINHPRVVEQVQAIVAHAAKCSVAAAIFAPTPEGARSWISQGVSFVAIGVDTAHVLNSFSRVAAIARADITETTGA